VACNKPITGFRAPGGQVKFNPKQGWIDRPITIACGQCAGCRLERSRVWAVRIMHEAAFYEPEECHFITLTYAPEHLPPLGTLVTRDWQDFARRARKKIGKFRYFHCGEYGDTTQRPHYHACVFGMNLPDLEQDGKTKSGENAFNSQLLEETWGKGITQVGALTFESAAYVARYVMKKVNGKKKEEGHYDVVDTNGVVLGEKKPEYTTMSRKPGIGKKWIEKYVSDVYPRDEVIINAKKSRPPKFYDGHYEILNPVGMETLKARRALKAKKHSAEQEPQRLDTKEDIILRKQWKRDL